MVFTGETAHHTDFPSRCSNDQSRSIAPIIERVDRERTASLRGIAPALNEEVVPTPSGEGTWTAATGRAYARGSTCPKHPRNVTFSGGSPCAAWPFESDGGDQSASNTGPRIRQRRPPHIASSVSRIFRKNRGKIICGFSVSALFRHLRESSKVRWAPDHSARGWAMDRAIRFRKPMDGAHSSCQIFRLPARKQ